MVPPGQSKNPAKETKDQFVALKDVILCKADEGSTVAQLLNEIWPRVPSGDGITYSAEVVKTRIPDCKVEVHVYPSEEMTACSTRTIGRWDYVNSEIDLSARTLTVRLDPHPDCGPEKFKMLVIHFVPKEAEEVRLPPAEPK